MSTPFDDAVADSRATMRSDRSGALHTRLRGRGLALARAAWVAAVSLIVAVFLARLPAFYTELQTVCTGAFCGYVQPALDTAQALQKFGLSVAAYADFTLALELALALLCITLGALIFWRKSDDWMALVGGLAVVASVALNGNVISMDMSSAWGWIAMALFAFAGGLYLLILALADGRFVTRWAPVVLLSWGLAVIQYFLVMNYFYALVWPGLLTVLLIAQADYRRTAASPIQRQQSKWFIFGGGVQLIIAVGTVVPPLVFPSLGQNGSFYQLVVNGLALILLSFVLPICIAIGILRYRLYDIDIIVRRTLVYGILTICIVGVYVLLVGGLGALIGASGNLVISFVATGLVAVLFQPLRAWLQRGVNRLLYGQRDEPYSVITHLSRRLEGTLAHDAVLSTIVDTVAQALKLPYVAVLLKQEETFALAARVGVPSGEPLVLPLIYQAETIGQMRLAPRTPGEPFTPADRRLLGELARQAGLAAHAVRLTADLQRSHEQLEQRVQERTHELASLLEISHTMASTLQLKPLLGLVLDQLKTVVEYTGASILTVQGENLVFLESRNPAQQEQFMQLRFPVKSVGLIWETISSREAIIVDDIREDTPLAQALRVALSDLRETTFPYMHAWMAVPLILRDQVSGMLVLTSDQAQAFTPRQATLALAIANQAAIAIENARLYAQAQELAALEERQKLARELHDSVSQALYGIALGLHTARIQLDRDAGKLPASLDDLLTLTEAALAEMRALIFELRPEALEREGLVAALAKQAAALQARYGLRIQAELCEEPNLPLMVKQELYRIAQEALHNTVKHARASKVDLVLRETSNAVILEVGDDGVGFDPLGQFPGHLGLRSMQERVGQLGGRLQIESAHGHGTRLLIQISSQNPSGDALGGLGSMS